MTELLTFPAPYYPSVAAAQFDYENALAHRDAASESLRQYRTAEAAEYYRAAGERLSLAVEEVRAANFRHLCGKLYETGRA